MSAPEYLSAVSAKRQFPTIDRLISDNKLDRHLRKWGHESISLGKALLLHAHAPQFPSLARSLETQLLHLEGRVYGDRIGTIVRNLLNGSNQFLNTLSELALAMRLQIEGWEIQLASPFHDGKKDADVRTEKDGLINFVEVVNLAPEPIVESESGFLPMPGSEPVDP